MSDTPPGRSESSQAPIPSATDDALYRVAQQTLRYGFLAAATLFVIGSSALALAGDNMAETVMPIDTIPGKLVDGEPMAILDLAFLMLIMTPVITVLRLAMTYFRLGERRFAMISFVVLAILVLSATVALLR